MVSKLGVAVGFLVLLFTVVEADAFSSGGRRSSSTASLSSTETNVVKAPEPTSIYALASGVLLLGGAAWLVRRK